MKMAELEILEPNVLLTHAHSDHADYVSFLHEKIPVYMRDIFHLILQAVEERSNRQIERDSILQRPHDKKDEPIKRKINT